MAKYNVFSRYNRAKGKEFPMSYCVSDAQDNDEDRPDAVVFPISECYDAATQRKRAYKFCDYLNTLAQVMEELEDEQKL